MPIIEVDHLTKEYRLGAIQGIKQTLLKMLAKISTPTHGIIRIDGRITLLDRAQRPCRARRRVSLSSHEYREES